MDRSRWKLAALWATEGSGGQRSSAAQGGSAAFTSIHPESHHHPEIRAGTDPAQRRANIGRFFKPLIFLWNFLWIFKSRWHRSSWFTTCRKYNHSMCRNINRTTDKIKKKSKCFTKWSTSLPFQYLLLVDDAWAVGGGGGGVLGDGGRELAAGSRPISWARGEMEAVRQKNGGEAVAWISVKPETLSLALEEKSFLNCGLIWLRGRTPPLQVKETDEFCVCWIALYRSLCTQPRC